MITPIVCHNTGIMSRENESETKNNLAKPKIKKRPLKIQGNRKRKKKRVRKRFKTKAEAHAHNNVAWKIDGALKDLTLIDGMCYRDYVIGAYIAAGVKTNDICEIMNTTPRTVKKIARDNKEALDRMNQKIVTAILNASAYQVLQSIADDPKKPKYKAYSPFPRTEPKIRGKGRPRKKSVSDMD